jgi:hypothetical protein
MIVTKQKVSGFRELFPSMTLHLVVLALGLLFVGACGSGVGNDGDLVGGACQENRECAERCQQGGDFPDGTCTVACNDDFDCPGGTACIDTEGGICLLLCNYDNDCRRNYECSGESRKGHSGDATVCIDD